MPDQNPAANPIQTTWTTALDAAREVLRGVGGNTLPAQRGVIRQHVETAARAAFANAGAQVKSVRANITWGEGNPTVELEVVGMDRQRYTAAGPTVAPRAETNKAFVAPHGREVLLDTASAPLFDPSKTDVPPARVIPTAGAATLDDIFGEDDAKDLA